MYQVENFYFSIAHVNLIENTIVGIWDCSSWTLAWPCSTTGNSGRFSDVHDSLYVQMSGSEKGVFWKRGLFRKVHLLEILENLGRDPRDFREPPDSGN